MSRDPTDPAGDGSKATKPARARLHFARFEFKYVLPDPVRADVEAELRHFLEFDPFVAQTPHHQYLVRSLYYDDPSLTAFHDKHDGLHTRSKFRVRTYSRDPGDDTPFFLELKGRHNNLVFKHRTPISSHAVPMLRAGEPADPERLVYGMTGPLAEQFRFATYRKQIQPVALIDYQRRPYISKYDPEFRLTFDDHLLGTETTRMFPRTLDRTRRIIPGRSVMEVKFRYHIPAWFHRVVQSFELRRVSISKICAGIEALEMAGDPS